MAKVILRKKNKARGFTLRGFRLYHKATVINALPWQSNVKTPDTALSLL